LPKIQPIKKEQETKWDQNKCLIDNLLYVDDGAFAYSSKQELENGTQQLHDHLVKFGLQMHVGSENPKSKTEAMFLLSSLEGAQSENETSHTSFTINGGGNNNVHFIKK